jgi:hypothetical protein
VTRTPDEQAEYEREKAELIERSERRQGRWRWWVVLVAVAAPVVSLGLLLASHLVPVGAERTPGDIVLGMGAVGLAALGGRVAPVGLLASLVGLLPLTPVADRLAGGRSRFDAVHAVLIGCAVVDALVLAGVFAWGWGAAG